MKSAYNKGDAEKIFKKYPNISRDLALGIYTSHLIMLSALKIRSLTSIMFLNPTTV